jgi:hypothetical protein
MSGKQFPPKDGAQSGVKDGETPNIDRSRDPDRPTEEEDVYGGAERAQKGEPDESENTKP